MKQSYTKQNKEMERTERTERTEREREWKERKTYDVQREKCVRDREKQRNE